MVPFPEEEEPKTGLAVSITRPLLDKLTQRWASNSHGTQRKSDLETQHTDRIKSMGMIVSYWEKSTGVLAKMVAQDKPGRTPPIREQVEDKAETEVGKLVSVLRIEPKMQFQGGRGLLC